MRQFVDLENQKDKEKVHKWDNKQLLSKNQLSAYVVKRDGGTNIV